MVGSSATPADKPLPGARAALILLLAINMFNYIDRQVLAAVLLNIEKTVFPEGGLHDDLLGLLTTAFMATYMLLAPVFGWLADRVSRWVIIGGAVIVWSLASGSSGLAPGIAITTGLLTPFWMLFATRCLVGVGEAAYAPAAPAMLSDYYPQRLRGRIMACFYVALPVGSALGYILGGQIASLTGDWRWAFYAVVPPGLLLGVLCFFRKDPPRGQADASAGSHAHLPKARDYLRLARIPSYVLATLGYTALTFAIGGIGAWLPKYVVGFRQYGDEASVGTAFGAILVVSGLVGTLLGGWLGDRLNPRFGGAYFFVSGIAMLLGFPLLLAALYTPFPAAWVLIFLACFCLFFNTGPINTILANVTHPAIRASGFALFVLFTHLFGDVISPPIMGVINNLNQGNMNPAFLLVSVAVLVSGLFWLWGAWYLKADTERAAALLNGKPQ